MTTNEEQPARVPQVREPHRGQIPALDGVRGLAVLLVLLFHYEQRRWPWRHGLGLVVKYVIDAGWSGVDLFFVLSGFLITGILWRSRGQPRYFRNFYARRTLRIFPLYYVVLLLVFVVLPFIVGRADFTPRVPVATQAWFWAYGCNILLAVWGWGAMAIYTAHFWSLAVEEQFYLVWPGIVPRWSRHGLMCICGAAIIVALLFRCWLVLSRGNTTAAFALTPARMDCLAVGALLALVGEGPSGLGTLVRRWRTLIAVWTTVTAVLILWRGTIAYTDRGIATIGYTIIAFAWGAVLVAALADGPVARAFSQPVLRWVGRRSYALYVLHYPIMLACDRSGWTVEAMDRAARSLVLGHLFFVGLNVGLTFLAAELSWRLLESRMLRLKGRFDSDRFRAAGESAPGGIVAQTVAVD